MLAPGGSFEDEVAVRELDCGHRRCTDPGIGTCLKCDQAYGKGVADALRIALSELPA